MRNLRPLPFSIVIGLTVVASTPAWAFSVKFSWAGIPACSSVSPAFTIMAAPRGTVALAFRMRDEDAPDFQHGGSSVAYAGAGGVPQGAVHYTGPCPPSGSSHRYVWTVDALGAEGKVLGSARATGKFP
ncbi:MAG TPA: phospholipid-binding protein [Lichenihabitans sp.]|jgi:hypothetical protein|nr:phospholipid-binding protein [Lichenihabitans sp.]